MNIYEEWGFKQAPFESKALPPNRMGKQLLVGRDEELRKVESRIANPPKVITVEGANGIGKTSLVNVAAFNSYMASLERDDGPLFIPCNQSFQLDPDVEDELFIDAVFFAIAQTLLEQGKQVEKRRRGKSRLKGRKAIDRWLNAPEKKTLSGGASLMGIGVSAGSSSTSNESVGFQRSGFRELVKKWLKAIFPTPASGGVICVIDNLELLQTSKLAQQRLERLRDKLITGIPGVRWVFCGALGVVLGVVASPRYDGLLHRPVEVKGITDGAVSDILASRIKAYEVRKNSAYLPIVPSDFSRLARIFRGNVRSLLGHIDDYCQWVGDENYRPDDDEEKQNLFAEWLEQESSSALAAVERQIKPRAWRVFDQASGGSGQFSPSDFADFGFNSIAALRPHVKDLEDAGLLVSARDEGDKRRKTIQVTTKGWLVTFAREME